MSTSSCTTAHQTPSQYERFRHFGHCTPAYAARVAKAGKVGRLLLFHHDPGRDDDGVDTMLDDARRAAAELGYAGPIDAAAEGDTYELSRAEPPTEEVLR